MSRAPTPRERLLIVALFVLLAVMHTFPLVLRLDSHIYALFAGDNYEYLWKTWWVGHAVTTPALNPFFHPDVYYPYGYPMAYGELTPLHTFGFLPVTLLFDFVTSYNAAVLASMVFTGWFTYEWAHYRLRRDVSASGWLLMAAALAAALAFTFYPNRIERIVGHMPMMSTHGMILALLGIDWWLDSRRPRDAVVIGLGIALAALASWYYPFMLLLTLPVYVLAKLGRGILPALQDARTWAALGIVAVVVGALTVPFLVPYLRLDTGDINVTLENVRFWSLSPLDYVLPTQRHPLWGGLATDVVWFLPGEMPYEFMVAPGYVVLILGLIGFRYAPNRALKWLTVTALVLSFGPFLNIGRIPTPVPLPGLAVYSLFPFGDSVRTYARFSLVAGAGFGLLAGYGYREIMLRTESTRRRVVISVVLVALAAFELRPWTWTATLIPVQPRPVDTWLAEQPDDAPIMQYPVLAALSGPAMLYTRYHGKPVIFGYGTYFPFIFQRDHPDLYTFPDDAAVDALAAWGVRYVLVDLEQLTDITLDDIAAQPRLQHVITLEGDAVYEILTAD